MAVLASFIGIDKYASPNVPELIGAGRDATALWALVRDSIPEAQAALLVNEVATCEAVRQQLQITLGAAGPADSVILFFAGHGSPSHRLLAHDTGSSDFIRTTVAMGDLAELFRESEAEYILCLLDCCFSGGANARVFEDGLIARDAGPPLDTLVQGKGRILFTASNTNQAAYEDSASRHGLFTKAILDVFTAAGDDLNLPTAVHQVMDRVRAEAARTGRDQTPMYFGQIEGGMMLPPLRPGPLFRAAFPERHGALVGADIQELSAFGLPPLVLNVWGENYPDGLNGLQLAAVNRHRILDGHSLLVVAPTSTGKTFVGEMAAVRAVTEGRKAVFLLPYKALVSEKYDQFDSLYGDQLGMRVIRCTSDHTDQTAQFTRGKYDLALLTYEMFLGLTVTHPSTLAQIGLVVVDEAQFLADPKRGVTVELLLTLLIAARRSGVEPQIVALSAVIGGVNRFDEWLGCESLVTDERPVKLVEGVLDHGGVYQYKSDDGSTARTQLVPRHLIRQRKETPRAQDVIVPYVQQLLATPRAKVIVFRNTRDKARSCANYLAKDLGLPPAEEALGQLPTTDQSSDSGALRDCLRGGTAFHSADLNREERAAVERAFRAPDDGVRVLAATTTVAAGINTPASVVILADHTFWDGAERNFTVAEYRNMAGRAGRKGYQEEGLSLLYAETPYEREQLFHRYVLGQPEPLRSSFKAEELHTWMLRLLAQVPRVPQDQSVAMLTSTYGGFLEAHRNPAWGATLAARLGAVVQEMLTGGLAEQYDAFLQLTPLGRACGRSTLSYASCLRLIQLLRVLPPATLTHERFMALVQNLPESDGGHTTYFKGGRKEGPCVGRAAARYGEDIVRLYLERAPAEEHQKRCKRACILGDWIDGVPIEAIEEAYNSNKYHGATGHGDIRRYADNTRYHLRAAHEIAGLVHFTLPVATEDVDALLKRLEVGVTAAALPLLEMPVVLGRGECMALVRAGMTCPEHVWAAPEGLPERVLGRERFEELSRSGTETFQEKNGAVTM